MRAETSSLAQRPTDPLKRQLPWSVKSKARPQSILSCTGLNKYPDPFAEQRHQPTQISPKPTSVLPRSCVGRCRRLHCNPRLIRQLPPSPSIHRPWLPPRLAAGTSTHSSNNNNSSNRPPRLPVTHIMRQHTIAHPHLRLPNGRPGNTAKTAVARETHRPKATPQ